MELTVHAQLEEEIFYPAVKAALRRADALLSAPVALPVLGDVLRYTVSAIFARATIKHMVETMFAPNKFVVLVRQGQPAAVWTGSTNWSSQRLLRPAQCRPRGVEPGRGR